MEREWGEMKRKLHYEWINLSFFVQCPSCMLSHLVTTSQTEEQRKCSEHSGNILGRGKFFSSWVEIGQSCQLLWSFETWSSWIFLPLMSMENGIRTVAVASHGKVNKIQFRRIGANFAIDRRWWPTIQRNIVIFSLDRHTATNEESKIECEAIGDNQ